MFEWTLMKRLIWIKAAVISGAASLYETVTGAIVSFVALHAKALKKLVVNIEPVQDLHGYDAPWPPGGGKNILDPLLKFTAGTYYGVTLSTTDGYNFTLTGTGTASGNIQCPTIPTADCVVYPAGTYTSTGAIFATYKPDGSFYANRQVGTWTADSDFIVRSAYVQIIEGATPASGSRFLSLAKGSTVLTEWSPYANECPISGWTGVKIWATGKNLFNYNSDYSDWSNGYLLPSGIPSGSTPSAPAYERTSPFIPVKGGQTYTLSYTPNTSSQLSNNCAFYDKDKNFIDGSFFGIYSVSQYTRTAPADAAYFRFSCRTYNLATEYQLETGSTKTAYEAYSGQEIDVPFPAEAGTVYGGKVTIKSDGTAEGTDGPGRSKLSDLSWTAGNRNTADTGRIFYCRLANIIDDAVDLMAEALDAVPYVGPSWESLAVNTITHVNGGYVIACADYADKTAFLAAVGDTYIVYDLITPQTFELSNQPVISTQVGQNNIWADAGDVEVTYYAK